LDFAIDMECDTTPQQFAECSDAQTFGSRGSYVSDTGETYYIGSRKSDRMARVYRFAAPHPRAHLLRAEIELKGDAAKKACEMLLSTSLIAVSLAAHAPFKWSHPSWAPEISEVSKLPARNYTLDNAGRLRWLDLTVVPAIKKASQEGLIDLFDWLDRHFPRK